MLAGYKEAVPNPLFLRAYRLHENPGQSIQTIKIQKKGGTVPEFSKHKTNLHLKIIPGCGFLHSLPVIWPSLSSSYVLLRLCVEGSSVLHPRVLGLSDIGRKRKGKEHR